MLSSNPLIARAIRENWNYETDWLWLATVVTTDMERYFCYDRVLMINPNSDIAQRWMVHLKGEIRRRHAQEFWQLAAHHHA
ncbi:MAG: hypothetical protein IT324_22620 [Anaerolineae bacterium]|nr:hypothetical protein [Anaerolineae bacterium]